MPSKFPTYLKLHVENELQQTPADSPTSTLEPLFESFQTATGWQLSHEPEVRPTDAKIWAAAVDDSPASGFLQLMQTNASQAIASDSAVQLADGLRGLMAELFQTRRALKQREAELAAGVPIVANSEEDTHLAERLESLLETVVGTSGCDAAALYLLDETTSELKLRACVGLNESRFVEPARPLRGALADLEALTGHAVVIEDAAMMPNWKIPEDFHAGVCVPVSSPTVPLGTFWVFNKEERTFSDEVTNLIEIVSGRIASDLERQLLLSKSIKAKRFHHEWSELSQWQEERVPQIAPLIDSWDIAGTWDAGEGVPCVFYDWRLLDDDRVALVASAHEQENVRAMLSSVAIQASLTTHWNYTADDPSRMLENASEMLWSSAAGDQFQSLFYAVADPASGQLIYSASGTVSLFMLRPHGWEPLECSKELLGENPDAAFKERQQQMEPGDVLIAVAWQESIVGTCTERPDITEVAESLLRQTHLSAEEIANLAGKSLRRSERADRVRQHTVLVAKREE